jgi:hypothetical protein
MILLLSSHMYVLIFKTCPSMTYIYTTIGLYTKSVDYRFSSGFYVFPETAKTILTGHVRRPTWTYPAFGF